MIYDIVVRCKLISVLSFPKSNIKVLPLITKLQKLYCQRVVISSKLSYIDHCIPVLLQSPVTIDIGRKKTQPKHWFTHGANTYIDLSLCCPGIAPTPAVSNSQSSLFSSMPVDI